MVKNYSKICSLILSHFEQLEVEIWLRHNEHPPHPAQNAYTKQSTFPQFPQKTKFKARKQEEYFILKILLKNILLAKI